MGSTDDAMRNPFANPTTACPSEPQQRWLSAIQLAAHLGISRRSVSNLMRRRVLPFVKIGRLLRFDIESCERALRQFESLDVTQSFRAMATGGGGTLVTHRPSISTRSALGSRSRYGSPSSLPSHS